MGFFKRIARGAKKAKGYYDKYQTYQDEQLVKKAGRAKTQARAYSAMATAERAKAQLQRHRAERSRATMNALIGGQQQQTMPQPVRPRQRRTKAKRTKKHPPSYKVVYEQHQPKRKQKSNDIWEI